MKVNLRRYKRGPGERKLDIKIDPWDTYSLDHNISLIILPMLLQLKYTKNGIPSDMVNSIGSDIDSNYTFDFIKDDEKEVFEMGCDKWDETLDKMIWSFAQLSIQDDYDDKYHHGTMDMGWEKTGKQFLNPLTGKMEETYTVVDKNPGEHWYDYIGHQLHDKRIQEGIDLFAKYFRALWD